MRGSAVPYLSVTLAGAGLALGAAPALAAPAISVGTVTASTNLAPSPGFVMGSTFTSFTVPVTVTDNGGGDTTARRVTITTTRTGGAGTALQLRSTGSSGSGGGVTWAVESVITGGTTATIVFRYAEPVLLPNGSVLAFTVSVPSVPTTTGDRVDTFTAALAEGSAGSASGTAPNGLHRYALEVTGVVPPGASAVAGTSLSPVVTVVNHSTVTQTLTAGATSLGGAALAVPGTQGVLPSIAAGASATVTFANAEASTVARPSPITANAGNATATAPTFSTVVAIQPGPLDHLLLTTPTSVTAGEPFAVTATASDAYGNTVTTYAGTVHLTSSDPHATLPGDADFLPGDLGVHRFSAPAALTTSGVASVSAGADGKTGSATITVLPGALAQLDVTPAATITPAGQQTIVTVQGFDAYGNDVGDQTPGSTLSISAPGSCLAGACGSFVTGDYTITATNGALTGTAFLGVVSGPLDHFALAAPFFATAGAPFDLTVTASDAYGNTVTDYVGTVLLTSDDPRATLPGTVTFTGNEAGGQLLAAGATLVTSGTTTIVASGSGVGGARSLDVLPGPLDHLALSPPVATITAGEAAAFTSTGYDAFGNGRGEVTASTTLAISPSGSCSQTACGASIVGDYVVTGGDGAATGTAVLHVVAAAIHHLVLVPAAATISAGTTTTLTAEGRDAFDNTLGDVTASAAFTITEPGSCTANVCGATAAGAETITATFGAATGTALLQVIAGPLDHLVLTPDATTITAGASVTFSVEGRDAFDNTLGDVTAGSAFTIGAGGSCSGSSCSATTAGDVLVTARNGVTSGSAAVTVVPAALDHLALDPATATITAGASTPFHAAGYDRYGNALGDVTAGTAFTISGAGSCSDATCGATAAGDYVVTAARAYDTATGSAVLHVTPGTLARLVLTPSSATTPAGSPVTFTAEGRDRFGNVIGDRTAAVAFTIDGPGTCDGNACSATAAGDYAVTAGEAYGTVTGHAMLHVDPAGLDHLIVTPAASSIAAGTTTTFSALGVDRYGNAIGDRTAGSTFAISGAGSCDGSACGADVAGDYTVTASGTYDLAGGATILHVTPAALARLDVAPATVTTAAGSDVSFTATGRDAFGNVIGDVTASTEFTIEAPGTCAAASCGATVAGAYTVTARSGSVTAVAPLHVAPAALDTLVLTPTTTTVAAGETSTYTTTGVDRYGNAIGDLTSQTTVTITPPGGCQASRCSATVAGDYVVTASDGPATTTATLHVTAAALDHLELAAAAETIAAGTTTTLAARGLDRFGNTLGDVTADAVLTIGPDGACTGSSCGATLAGVHTVTATDGAATGTATLQVVAGPLDHLVLAPADATVEAGATVTYRSEGRDAFDNTLGDVTAASVFTIDDPGTCEASRCGSARVGDSTVTVSAGGVTASTVLHVTAAPLDHLVLTPSPGALTAGETATFTATGADRFGNDLGDLTAEAVFGIARPGSCSGHSCRTTVAGDVIVTAAARGVSGRTMLHVTAGPLAWFVLSPAAPTIVAGTARTFSATGYDRYRNLVGDVASSTTFTIDDPGTCDANACGATVAGTYVIVALNGSATATTSLIVTAAAADRLTLSPDTTTIAAGGTATYATTAVDRFGNPLGDVTARTTFTIDPPGTCSGAACGATAPGDYVVTASDGTATGSAPLHVVPGA